MKNQHRVVWTKGMFLNPQHFQTQDQYFEDTLQFRFASSNYANWGVTALQIDTEALASGLFKLVKAYGIMPDGLTFRMPDVDALPGSRDIAEFFSATTKEVDVYLAIPEHRFQAINVAMPSSSGAGRVPDSRYSAETHTAVDFNSGAEQKDVQVARKNFRLLVGSEYREGFTGVRVAQVVRSAKNIYELKRTHIAPCLDIGHSTYLLGLLETLVGILSSKSASLSAGRAERGKSLADFTASETTNFWLLHTVNSSLPELKHIGNVRHGHPEQAYLALTRLAGAMATFSLEASLDNLPDYDHKDLGSCFSKLESQLRELVDTVIVEAFITIPLSLGDRDIWRGTIPDDRYFEDSQFYLSVRSDNDAGELIQKVPLVVRAAAPDQIDRRIKNALPGITLMHASAPQAIRMKLGNQYFALGQTGELWQQVKNSRSIAIFTPGDIKQPKLELIIVKSNRE